METQISQPPLDVIEFERLITDLSARFVEVDSSGVDDCINGALEAVAKALDLDRVTLSRLDPQTKRFYASHVWAAPGIDTLNDFLLAEDLDWAARMIFSGSGICFSRPEDLPEEASSVADWFRSQGVLSHVTIPMRFANRMLGGFHVASMRRHIDWAPLHPRLETLSRIFTAAIERRRMDTELKRALAELESLQQQTTEENVNLRQQLEFHSEGHQIVGGSPALLASLDRASKVAPTESAILILGETGTGKGLLAEQIHKRSSRADGPLIQIDCTALPATLIESELFGYEKGAFSGANQQKKGRFELAHNGTLMLDEIGELPDDLQSKFLRVLESGKMSRLGSTRTLHVDVRVIAATNRELQHDVTAGRFRADLFYRLSVFPIVLPPLRDRAGDIPLLSWFFVEQLQAKFGRNITEIPQSTIDRLESYNWPGNVRELRNVIERSLILNTGDELEVEDLIPKHHARRRTDSDDLRNHEREHIQRVLSECGGRIKGAGGAAERLGIKPSTLYYRLKKLGIERSG